MAVRRARQVDWDGARALWREVDEVHAALAPAYFRPTARIEREWHDLLSAPDTASFVAEAEGGDVAGLAVVRIYETPPDPAMVPLRRGHVETLIVSQQYRRRGHATRLMAEIAAWARREDAAELVLTVWAGNAEAEAFYARLDYRVLSRVLHAKL